MGIRAVVFSIGLAMGFSALPAADLFSIAPESFVKNKSLNLNEKIYLAPVPGDTLPAVSRPIPTAGKFYLRQKLNAKTYAWYEGEVSEKAFEALYVFTLKDKGLSVSEMMGTKLFGTRNAKAFQDEQDIYFDKDNLYTSRVPTLYFVQNGVWQTLESQPVSPGLLIIESQPSASITVNGIEVGKTPLRKGPAQPGIWTYVLEAPGHLPIAMFSNVESRKATRERVVLLPIDTTLVMRRSPVATAGEIASARNLIELERIYDRIDSVMRIPLQPDSNQLVAFDSIYPSPKRPIAGQDDTSGPYVQYLLLYKQTRSAAMNTWFQGGVDSNKLLLPELRNRIRHFESMQVRGQAKVRSASFAKTDSSGKTGILRIELQSDDQRLVAKWEGVWSDSLVQGDSLAAKLVDTLSPVPVYVTAENKPVWIEKPEKGYTRHFYRLLKLELGFGDQWIPVTGEFVLPDSIARQPEVAAWLAAQKKPIQPDTTKLAPTVLDTAALYKIYLADYYRGKVMEIPGGRFRYKDKLVEISPFAINATEVSQIHYERIRQKNPSRFKDLLKPIHNIDWYTAKSFCEEIGGNLPTEAQWEFAARAGSNKGRIWNIDSSLAADHSVYYEVSEALGKKNPAYGPQEVGKRKANAFGLFDMAGNVAEWTRDNSSWFSFQIEPRDPTGAYFGHFKMFKGGSWKTKLKDLNVISSDDEDPRYWGPSIGFRCVFPSNQKIEPEQVKQFFAKRQVTIPPFVAQAPQAPAPASTPAPTPVIAPKAQQIQTKLPAAPSATMDTIKVPEPKVDSIAPTQALPKESKVIAPETPAEPVATSTQVQPVVQPSANSNNPPEQPSKP